MCEAWAAGAVETALFKRLVLLSRCTACTDSTGAPLPPEPVSRLLMALLPLPIGALAGDAIDGGGGDDDAEVADECLFLWWLS